MSLLSQIRAAIAANPSIVEVKVTSENPSLGFRDEESSQFVVFYIGCKEASSPSTLTSFLSSLTSPLQPHSHSKLQDDRYRELYGEAQEYSIIEFQEEIGNVKTTQEVSFQDTELLVAHEYFVVENNSLEFNYKITRRIWIRLYASVESASLGYQEVLAEKIRESQRAAD